MNGLAGAAVWAIVPFVPEAPFRIYAGEDHAPVAVPDAEKLVKAATQGSDTQFTFLVPGKARPVLIVSDAHHDDLGELLALRLVRFSKLEEAERDVVRRQGSQTLFHLPPDRFPGLPEENAALVASLVRVHTSAVGGDALGRLDRQGLAVVHEKLVRHYGFDLRTLVRDELRRLAELQRRRPS